jgi:hypothetical protein
MTVRNEVGYFAIRTDLTTCHISQAERGEAVLTDW